MATTLKELIEDIEKDDLPTNEFTIEDEDPMVILGKLNEVIAYLETLQATINASDSKANEALQKAIQAVADATQALSVANGIDAKATQALANAIEAVGTANTALSASNTALSTSNTAISTANTALSSANSAVETAEDALGTAESAETKADTAETKAQKALDQVVYGLGTKVYRETQLLPSLDIKPIEDDIADNTTAITALQNDKVDKVAGKQLSTEDFTTAEKSKLAGLNNYDDTQLQADISTLMDDVEELGNELNTTNTNLNNEATARQSADTTLQNNIDSEASARENADTTLQTQIDTLNDKSETIEAKGNTKLGVNYIKYNSGILICWGTTTPSSKGTFIILPTPFVNTDYSVGATNNTIKNNQIRALATTNYTTASFKTVGQYSQSNSGHTDGDVTFTWIAIGFWK